MNARRGIAVIATLLVASVMLLVSLPAEIPPATAARPYALQSSYPRVVATINVGAHPWFDDWNPVRDMWFVANEGAGTVSAIYAQTGVLAATITVGSAPKGVENVSVASTGQNEVWVTNSGSGTVSVINATTLTVAHTIGIGTNAERLCYDSGNRTVFVMNRGSNNISVIGTGNYTDWGSIPTGSQPIGCYFDDDTSTLFVADYAANIVQAFNGSTFALIANITGFNGPTVIAHDFSPYHEIFVSDWGSGEVSVVNDRSHIIVANITVGTNPYGIGFDAQTAQAFVTNSGGNTVSIISAERNWETSWSPYRACQPSDPRKGSSKPYCCPAAIAEAIGSIDMFCTPPATMTSLVPLMTAWAAKCRACCDEPHWRSMVVPGTSSGSPAASQQVRAMSPAWGPMASTHPKNTSSTALGSMGLRSTMARRM